MGARRWREEMLRRRRSRQRAGAAYIGVSGSSRGLAGTARQLSWRRKPASSAHSAGSPHILAGMHDSPPGGSPTDPWLDWRPCLTRAPRVPPGNSFPLCSRPPALRSRFTLDRRWFTLCCWLPRLAPCVSASESHSHYARQPLLGQAYPYSCLIRPPLTQTAAHHHPAISNALHAA